MQGIKDDQVAKAKGLGVIGLMVVVAAAVHYWPRGERVEPAAGVEPVMAATAPAAAAEPAPAVTRRAELQFRRVRLSAVQTVAPEPKPILEPDALPIVTLTALPGTQSEEPEPWRPASFVPTLAPPLAPAPIVETQPARTAERSGALTVAAKATGKGLAVAFQKTGAAFRRVF